MAERLCSILIMESDGLHAGFIRYSLSTRRRHVYRNIVEYMSPVEHTTSTIMVANGCGIRIVKEVLGHKDIRTTLRYAHVSDKTKREKYEPVFDTLGDCQGTQVIVIRYRM